MKAREAHLHIGTDDTGHEGESFTSRSVDPARVTLVSAVIDQRNSNAFAVAWRDMLTALRTIFPNIGEFHASKLWDCKLRADGMDKKQAMASLLQTIQGIAKFCETHDVHSFVQTVHDETVSQVREALPPTNARSRGLDHVALALDQGSSGRKRLALYLSFKLIRRFMLKAVAPDSLSLHVQWEVDWATDLNEVHPDLRASMSDGFDALDLRFVRSYDSEIVQLADYAAFVVNRTLHLSAKKEQGPTRDADLMFLEVVKPCLGCFKNIPTHAYSTSKEMTPGNYDELLDAERRNLQLDPLDFKKRPSNR